MVIYRYQKAELVLKTSQKKIQWSKIFSHFLPNFLIILGSTFLTIVGYPFFSHEIIAQRWTQSALIAPVPEITIAEAKGFVVPSVIGPIATGNSQVLSSQTGPEIIGIDYTKAANWFPTVSSKKRKESKTEFYHLTIPKLKIRQARVKIGGEDLNKSLIHYGGTALPGEYGNVVIFGHSVLPAFYNPRDYHAIFSTLPTLKRDDEILIDFDGLQFKYKVEEYKEVKPDDIEMLEQKFDRRTLSLVTCVPPGTYLRRGIIRANLVPY